MRSNDNRVSTDIKEIVFCKPSCQFCHYAVPIVNAFNNLEILCSVIICVNHFYFACFSIIVELFSAFAFIVVL